MSFFWFQKAGSDRTWHRATAETRAKIISEVKPTFVTVLDASDVPEEGWTKEQFLAMRYSGPLYFDWDAEDCADTITDFVEMLTKLKEHGLNLDCVHIFATGGRGFHLEIPMGCLMAKPPSGGILQLPYIYKEIARRYMSDTLDMRVYSARMGRMWRTPGVQRDNGNYKVQISAEEALGVTAESYAQLVASPRPALAVLPPEFCAALNGDFAEAKKKVDTQSRAQKKAKNEVSSLKAFNGDYPPAVLSIMKGENYAPDKGFNQIAMQLAITANALGKSEADFMASCETLAKEHKGDSDRYNSPRKRKEALREMYWYTNDNDLYSYSVGGIKNICSAEVPTMAVTGQAEASEAPYEESLDTADLEDVAFGAVDYTIYQGLKMTPKGLIRRTSEGDQMLSHILMRKSKILKEPATGVVIGMVSEIAAHGKTRGVRVVPMDCFNSRASFARFCAGYSTTFTGTDTQAAIVGMILTEQAEKGGNVEYVVRREGIDLIQNPAVNDLRCRESIWASPTEVMIPAGTAQEVPVTYAFKPIMTDQAIFNSDLWSANTIEDTEETREWLHAVLSMNSKETISQVLGWFVAAFNKQHYQEAGGQFPLLHLYGTAGCGKTKTAEAFHLLHYNKNKPKLLACGTSTTSYALKSAFASSASIPLVLDEYKPSELPLKRQEELLMAFRLAYNQADGASGGMSNGSAESSFRSITTFSYSTPLVYLGESQEMQSAVMQRSVAVGFSSHNKNSQAHERYLQNPEYMSQLGRLVLDTALSETVAGRRVAVVDAQARIRGGLTTDMHDRQIFNLAVLICGLELLRDALHEVFKDAFDAELNSLVQTILDSRSQMAVQVVAESIKVLSDMAMISRMEDPENPDAIREGHEYIVRDGHIEILMKEAFIKYHSWCKRKGFNPLYRSAETFVSAMAKTPACTDYLVMTSPLKKSVGQKVFRFSLEKLRQDGCDDFKTKQLGN